MGNVSSNKKALRRARRGASRFKQAARVAQAQCTQAQMLLVCALAQCGGDVAISAGTWQQVRDQHGDLVVVTRQGKVSGEFIIRLQHRGSEGEAADSLQPQPDPDTPTDDPDTFRADPEAQ